MAMKRRNFDRVYPRVRFASSGMTRNHSQNANPRTGNRNVGRAAVALAPSDRGRSASIVAATRQMNQLQCLGQPNNSTELCWASGSSVTIAHHT